MTDDNRSSDPRVPVTKNRLLFLSLLADNGGPLAWDELLVDGRAKSSNTFRPMIRAGWITAEFREGTWWFVATPDGLKLLRSRA